MEREAVLGAIGKNGFDYEAAVLQRYGEAAREVESCLCLPVSYDPGAAKGYSQRDSRKGLRLRRSIALYSPR